MTMHILTLQSAQDILLVQDACRAKWNAWIFTVTATELGEKLTAEWDASKSWVKRKRLTDAEMTIMWNVIPAFAQAFHAGLCKGREEKV